MNIMKWSSSSNTVLLIILYISPHIYILYIFLKIWSWKRKKKRNGDWEKQNLLRLYLSHVFQNENDFLYFYYWNRREIVKKIITTNKRNLLPRAARQKHVWHKLRECGHSVFSRCVSEEYYLLLHYLCNVICIYWSWS